MEILNEEIQSRFPTFAKLQRDTTFIECLQQHLPQLGITSQALKAQHNLGNGGCFPMHSDSDMGIDKRQLSCVVYLNPNWKKGDGGEIRLYPFPYPHVDVEPLHDRLVMFSSANMLHRVLPSTQERFCFTIWLSGDGARTIDSKEKPDVSDKNYPWELLLAQKYRKHVARIVYASEWAESLSQSHDPEKAETLLQDHRKKLSTIFQVFASNLSLISQYLPFEKNNPPPKFKHEMVTWF